MKFDWTSIAIGAAIGYMFLPGIMGKELVEKDKPKKA